MALKASAFTSFITLAVSVQCAPAPLATRPIDQGAATPSQLESTCRSTALNGPEQAHLSVHRGVSSLVEFLVSVSNQSVPHRSVDQERALACQLFRQQEVDVPMLLQSLEALPTASVPSCAVGEVSFPGADGDGRWHLIGFPGELFVALYEPPQRDFLYPPMTWTLRKAGAFAVHEALQAAYVCPTSEADHCVAWNPRQDEASPADSNADPRALPTQFFCTDERALPCESRGYTTEVYVLEPNTGRALMFGPFERQEQPTIAARPGSRDITITGSTCRADVTL